MNAICERFNRTLQEQFGAYHKRLAVITELKLFNEKMIEYVYFYNIYRPHKNHGLITPKQTIIKQQQQKCNMYLNSHKHWAF